MNEQPDGNWVEAVKAFWFGELGREQWFSGDEKVDATIRARFGELYRRLNENVPAAAWTEPDAALAAILVLDQFPRNIHRGKAEAFASDTSACALARNAVEKELDAGLSESERAFLYMPFMHSEILADQERGVSLFKSLGDPVSLKFAEEHRDAIARFGRFPHRNKVLGRESTPDELEFLETANRYGQ